MFIKSVAKFKISISANHNATMKLSWKNYLGGSLAIGVYVLAWQLQAELLQGLSEPSSPNYYDKVQINSLPTHFQQEHKIC